MPLASGLLVRTLARPGGRLVTVVLRRSRASTPLRRPAPATQRIDPSQAEGKPDRPATVPAEDAWRAGGFSRPVARALAALGSRARPAGRDGVALDGRVAPLVRVIVEANRRLAAAGRPPIAYPGARPREAGR